MCILIVFLRRKSLWLFWHLHVAWTIVGIRHVTASLKLRCNQPQVLWNHVCTLLLHGVEWGTTDNYSCDRGVKLWLANTVYDLLFPVFYSDWCRVTPLTYSVGSSNAGGPPSRSDTRKFSWCLFLFSLQWQADTDSLEGDPIIMAIPRNRKRRRLVVLTCRVSFVKMCQLNHDFFWRVFRRARLLRV